MRKGEAEREEEARFYLLFMGFMAEPNLLPWSRASGPAGAAAAATEVPSSVTQATKTSTVSVTLYHHSVNCKSVHFELPGIWILQREMRPANGSEA